MALRKLARSVFSSSPSKMGGANHRFIEVVMDIFLFFKLNLVEHILRDS
jgi:hypothetical protein